jgi:branched-chain amino acid transport system substrate-binding protein
MKRSSSVLSALLLVLALVFVASPTGAQKTIKIGIVDTYTGPALIHTQNSLDAFKMVVDKLNASGGVLGRKIEYMTRDDKFRPEIALTMVKELIIREQVDILMGTINSAAALAISNLAKEEKIPFFVTHSKSDKITGEKGHRYVFGMNENTLMAGRAGAAFLAKKPYIRYWIAGDDYEYGHSIADSAWTRLKALKPGVQLVGQSWWKVGEADFTPYILPIMSAKPDFLIGATGAVSMTAFQKAAQQTGLIKAIPIWQHTAIDYTILLPLGLDAPEGVFGSIVYPGFYYPDNAGNKAFVDEYKKLYNRLPSMTAFFGYNAAQFIVRGLQKAGTTDKEKFIDAVRGLSYESFLGRIEVRACDNQVIMPMVFGVTKKDPRYPFLVAGDMTAIPPMEYMPSCEEVLKSRK